MKICGKCKIEKDYKCFYKDKRVSSGLMSCCKDCKNKMDKESLRKRIEKNPDTRKGVWRRWSAKNKHINAWRMVLKNANFRMGKEKQSETIKELGYSALDLKNHLESQFKDGMSWDNHGEWHIDHVIPVSSFDKSTHSSIVNALSNLQPLWAYENLSKGSK